MIEQEPMKEEQRPEHSAEGEYIIDVVVLTATACTAAGAATTKIMGEAAVDTLILRRLLLRIRHLIRHLELPTAFSGSRRLRQRVLFSLRSDSMLGYFESVPYSFPVILFRLWKTWALYASHVSPESLLPSPSPYSARRHQEQGPADD